MGYIRDSSSSHPCSLVEKLGEVYRDEKYYVFVHNERENVGHPLTHIGSMGLVFLPLILLVHVGRYTIHAPSPTLGKGETSSKGPWEGMC